MNLINKEFCNLLRNHYLTENVSLFLYSLIRCTRPQSIIEVGAGYSTLFISEAIEDIRREDVKDYPDDIWTRERDQFIGEGYKPLLTVVENGEEENHLNPFSTGDIPLYENINFVQDDIDNYLTSSQENYDLVWMDFGGGLEFMYYFRKFLDKLNGGGCIIVQSTIGSVAGRLFSTELKLLAHDNSELEIMSFVEPHKQLQNSFTVIKRMGRYHVYSWSS